MSSVLVVSDLPSLRAEVRATIESPQIEVIEASSATEALALAAEHEVDLAILDLQVGSMGGMAICFELHHAESLGELDHVAVLMLLDRRPDVFLARRSGAEGFCVKPLDPGRLRRAVRALLDGDTFEDPSWRPQTVGVPGTAMHG